MKAARRVALALALALGAPLGACSFIEHFPDVAPDPDTASSSGSAGGGGSPDATSTSTASGSGAGAGGMDGASTSGASIGAARYGGAADQRGRALAAAGLDAILLSVVSGVIDPGVEPLPDLGDPALADLVLARYTPTLSCLWQKRFADSALGGAAVSPDGDVLLAAGSTGDVDFGGGVLPSASTSTQDVTVARLDASGKHLWSRRFGDAADQFAAAVAVDAQGDAIVTGGFAGTLSIGPGAPLVSAGAPHVFVAKLDPAGAPLWSRAFGAPMSPSVATSVAVDSAGNLLLAGYFKGTLDLGGPLLVSQGDTDAFVAKLDPTGAPLWSLAFGGPASDKSFAVAVGPTDAVFVAGGFRGLITFGALPAVASPTLNDQSGFLVAINAAGEPLWVRAQTEPMGTPAGTDQASFGVAVDAEGNAVLTGFATGTTVFDAAAPLTSARTAAGASDAFVAKYGPGGALLWARLFGDAAVQSGVDVAVGPLGSVWATGFFLGSLDFATTPPSVFTSAGGADLYLARFAP